MSVPCPDCETAMKPADGIDSEKANHVCPECAPDFILCRATSETDLQAKEYGYETE